MKNSLPHKVLVHIRIAAGTEEHLSLRLGGRNRSLPSCALLWPARKERVWSRLWIYKWSFSVSPHTPNGLNALTLTTFHTTSGSAYVRTQRWTGNRMCEEWTGRGRARSPGELRYCSDTVPRPKSLNSVCRPGDESWPLNGGGETINGIQLWTLFT